MGLCAGSWDLHSVPGNTQFLAAGGYVRLPVFVVANDFQALSGAAADIERQFNAYVARRCIG